MYMYIYGIHYIYSHTYIAITIYSQTCRFMMIRIRKPGRQPSISILTTFPSPW